MFLLFLLNFLPTNGEEVPVVGLQVDGVPTNSSYLLKKFTFNPKNTTICTRFKMLWRRQPMGAIFSFSSNFTDSYISLCK